MARVRGRAPSVQAVRARSRVPKPNIRKHKIVMESVTQEKKKLRSVISFEAKAPPGYTFIPAGNPVFTNACKEVCRKEGHKVFTVSTTPHQRMHDLSQQVHRIGYHFPSVVVATICMERGFFLSSMGKVVPYRQGAPKRRADSDLSQNAINTEARDAIKDLFPNIPKKDLGQIIKTAFQKGKKKVGTAVELPLARRAQLAVVAHIRHIYTDYDRLLRVTSFQEARSAVEEPTLAKLVAWRGDDENGRVVLEDVFREVIVISDEEDDESESEGTELHLGDRDSSVEVVSSRTIVGELQTKPVNYGHRPFADQNLFLDQSDDEAPPPGFRFVPEAPRTRKTHKQKSDRRGFSRYQAWDRAIDRFRAGPITCLEPTNPPEAPYPASRPVRRPIDQTDYFRTTPIREALPPTPRIDQTNTFHDSITLVGEDGRNNRSSDPGRRRAPPDIIRMSDGTVFERAIGPHRTNHNVPPSERERMERVSVNIRPRIHPNISEQVRYQMPRDTMQHPQGHRIIPSIEEPMVTDPLRNNRLDHSPKRRHANGPSQQSPPRRGPLESFPGSAKISGINDGRYQTSRKINKVEHDSDAHGDSRTGSGRAFPAASAGDQRNNQNPAAYPLGRNIQEPVGGQLYSPIFEKYPPAYRQDPEQQNLRPRRLAAGMPPVHDIAHNQSSGDFVDHEQPKRNPQSRHFARSDGSGYIPRYDNHPIRSRPLSHFTPSQQESIFLDPDRVEASRIQGHRSDRSRPALARSASPNRRKLASSPRPVRSDMYAHDFIRPVQWHGQETAFGYKRKISSREVPTSVGSGTRMYPPVGPSRLGADQRFVPSGHPPFQSQQAISHPSTSRDPFPGPYQVSLPNLNPSLDSGNIASIQRRYNPEIIDSHGDSLQGRYYPHVDPQRPTPRYPPARTPIFEGGPTYYGRIPARNELFATGDH